MFSNSSNHTRAVWQALFVTFLWAISWVLIKIGLGDIPALTFAGLRYTLAAIVLWPVALRSGTLVVLKRLTRREWAGLVLLGILLYTITQGAQFLGLYYLPAITVTLLLNFTSVIVALFGLFMLAERPSRLQWGGLVLCLAGALIFFYPVSLPGDQTLGLVIVVIGVFANSFSALLGRRINREAKIPPLPITLVSMGVGGVVLLATGLLTQGLPALSLTSWLIIVWLAVVNTAFAFNLWNHTLRTLSAMESSIINNTITVQIALLAWLFLGEQLTLQKLAGMGLVVVGTLVVQLYRPRK